MTPARRAFLVRAAPPVLVGGVIALIPVPEGLRPQAWYYFALFAAVIVGVATEPIPPGAIGLAGVVIAAMSGLVFKNPTQAVNWALSGFGQPTIWLIFGAYVLSVGYEKTGLGKRIALLLIRRFGSSTLGLGYAITLTDLAIAPFTPSNTARSGGTIYPVIRNIPGLYGSEPGPTARRIGGYLMYVALCATCVTSSMFPTALAPNILAVLLIAETVGVIIPWIDWVTGFLPVGILLLVGMPPLIHWIYPPQITGVATAPVWASDELRQLGPMRRIEWLMLSGTLLVISLWIGGSRYTDATTAALLGVVLLVVRGVVSWDDILANRRAWDTVMWIATLVTMASGLVHVEFVPWVAATIKPMVVSLSLPVAVVFLVAVFFFVHYLFATISGHATALLPLFLVVAVNVPGLSAKGWALALAYTFGLMGILTPYATGPSPVYYGCGYISRTEFWILGFVVGSVFLGTYLLIGVPWLVWRSF